MLVFSFLKTRLFVTFRNVEEEVKYINFVVDFDRFRIFQICNMSEIESVADKSADYVIFLYQLPVNVLEYICQLLIDSASTQERLFHVRTLRDVMSLRASCSVLNDVIKDLVLYIRCYLASEWEFLPLNYGIYAFINFMSTETNWRFKSLEIGAKMMRTESDLMPFVLQNEKVFLRSLKKVKIWLNMPDSYQTITNKFFDWLKEGVMKDNAEVEILLASSNYSGISDCKLVTKLVVFSYERLNASKLQLYSNLTELRIYGAELQVETLTAFPNLKILLVDNLVLSEPTHISTTPNFDKIRSLIIHMRETDNGESLPDIISRFFPSLVHFDFSGYLRSVDFYNLPKSCISVRTSLEYLHYFHEKNSIENIALYSVRELTSMNKKLMLVPPGISVLDITLSDKNLVSTLSQLTELISDILKIFRSLEVLSIWLSFGDKSAAEISLQKLFCGGIHREGMTSLFQFELEWGEFCLGSKLQLLVLGQTVLMKKTASYALLRRVDNFMFENFWILNHGSLVLLPLEILTGT